MKISKIADGAYFVTPYSVQTLIGSYDHATSQQVLHGSGDRADIYEENKGIWETEENEEAPIQS